MECHQLELAFKKSKCTKRQIEMRSFDRKASFLLQKLCFFSKVFLPSFATVKRSNSTKAEGGVLYFSRGATSSSKSCFSKLQVPSNFKFLRLPDVQESGKSCVHCLCSLLASNHQSLFKLHSRSVRSCFSLRDKNIQQTRQNIEIGSELFKDLSVNHILLNIAFAPLV